MSKWQGADDRQFLLVWDYMIAVQVMPDTQDRYTHLVAYSKGYDSESHRYITAKDMRDAKKQAIGILRKSLSDVIKALDEVSHEPGRE